MSDAIEVTADFHFTITPDWVFDSVTPRGLQVYTALARYINHRSRETFVGRKRIAEACRCTIATVDRAIEELKSVGALTVQMRYVDGRQTTNLYTLRTVPVWAVPSDATGGEVGISAEGGVLTSEEGGVLTSDEGYNQTQKELSLGDEAAAQQSSQNPTGSQNLATGAEPEPELAATVNAVHGKPATKSEAGKWRAAVKELADAGVTGDEYRTLVAACSSWDLVTPAAIARNLTSVRGKSAAVTPKTADERQADLDAYCATNGHSEAGDTGYCHTCNAEIIGSATVALRAVTA